MTVTLFPYNYPALLSQKLFTVNNTGLLLFLFLGTAALPNRKATTASTPRDSCRAQRNDRSPPLYLL